MRPTFPIATAVAALLAQALAAGSARAELQAVGHEFRPTVAQAAGTDPCEAADGSTASLVFRCNESSPGYCPNPAVGKLSVEWRSAEDELEGEQLVAEGYYSYGPPFSCSADGAMMVLLEPGVRVVDRDGPRGPAASICAPGASCWGPFGVSADAGGFLVFWAEYNVGLLGRRYDSTGAPTTAPFVIHPAVGVQLWPAKQGLLLGDDAVLLAWRRGDAGILTSILAADGTLETPLQVNEYPRLEWPNVIRLGLEEPGVLRVMWKNETYQAGWVARRVSRGDVLPTTTTTTTTLDLAHMFLPAVELAYPAIGDATYHTEPPELTGSTSGEWISSWADHVLDDAQLVLGTNAANSDDDGRTWSPPWPLHASDYPAAFSSSLTGDGDGITIDAWVRADGARILFRRSTDGGESWSEKEPLYDSPYPTWDEDLELEIGSLVVVPDGSGNWLAAWTELAWAMRPCPPDDEDCIDYVGETLLCAVRTAVSTDDGQTWSGAQSVHDENCWSGNVLAVAGDGDGNWLVAWADQSQADERIVGVYSTDGGEEWSPAATLLSDVALDSPELTAAVSSDGRWLIAFAQWRYDPALPWPDNVDTRVFVSTAEAVWAAWEAPAPVAPWHDEPGGADVAPWLAPGDDGEVGLAWASHSSDGGLDADIVVSFSDDGGQTWSRPRTVDTDAATDARRDLAPRLLRVGPTWAVAWRSVDPRTILFARTRGDCGNGDVDPKEECDDANLVEGDGCDSTCLPTGCGSFVVTGGEECDDGNDDDADACVSCVLATCGDGVVRAGVEECDDGNSVETDACLGACTAARCGDGVVRPGFEQCDDGDATGNNDACLDACVPAACGDGYLQLGEEECDDANATGGDACTAQCLMNPDCGFFDRDGLRVTASDALKVLKRAVGGKTRCPLRDCDRNHDGKLSASDALWTLRSAVGLFPDGCSLPDKLVLRMTSGEKLGALQVRIVFRDAAGHVVAKNNGKPSCTVSVPSVSSAMNLDQENGLVRIGLISLPGFQGPLELVRCDWDPVSGPALHDFQLTIEDASDVSSWPVDPLPVVELAVE